MRRGLISLLGMAWLFALFAPAQAEDLATSLVGLWKVISLTSKVSATGEVRQALGTNPGGYILFTRGGHVIAFLVGGNRKAPASPNATDAERVELYKTLAAWSGTYEVKDNKVVVHVDASWNQSWTGTDVVRSVEISGNKLITASKSVTDGQDVINAVTYERVE